MPILSGKARVAGVIGWPVGHSRSPCIHNFWLERHNIDGAYVPLPVAPEHFAQAIAGLRAAGLVGVNVTVPHKLAALAACDEADAAAMRIGAANVLTFRQDRIIAANTDAFGFLASLEESGIAARRGPALVLGAGGAARAIAAALTGLGVEVTVANRTPARVEQLRRDFPGLRQLAWSRRSEALGDFALLVNATSLGMEGQPKLDFDLGHARPDLAVVDIVYSPLETDLLRAAGAAGLRTSGGLAMLLHQARPAFVGWFGVEPAVDAALRAAVQRDLAAR